MMHRKIFCLGIFLFLAVEAATAQAVPLRVLALHDNVLGGLGGDNIAINDSGQAVFLGSIKTSTHTDSGFLTGSSHGVTRFATRYTPVPGVAGTLPDNGFDRFQSPLHINEQGDLAAQLSNHNSVQGIWVKRGGAIQNVVQNGAPLTAAGAGVNYAYANNRFVFNNNSDTAFWAFLNGSGVTANDDQGIFVEQNGVLQQLIRKGELAPGASADSRYTQIGYPVMNNSGTVAFGSELAGPNIGHTSQGGAGIWKGAPGNVSNVVLTSQAAPGAGTGLTFSGVNHQVPLGFNSAGHVAFEGSTSGPGFEGVWKETNQGLELVALGGTQAPGLDPGIQFAGIGGANDETIVLNDAGNAAFVAKLSGPGVVRNENDLSLWSEGTGELEMVARTGDAAPGFGGATFWFFGSRVLNANGQLAFQAIVRTGPRSSESGIWAQDANGDLQLVVSSESLLETEPGQFSQPTGLHLPTTSSGNADGRPSWFNDQGELVFSVTFPRPDRSVPIPSAVYVADLGIMVIPEPSTVLLTSFALVLGMLPRARRHA